VTSDKKKNKDFHAITVLAMKKVLCVPKEVKIATFQVVAWIKLSLHWKYLARICALSSRSL
jgi:hypothetical protein